MGRRPLAVSSLEPGGSAPPTVVVPAAEVPTAVVRVGALRRGLRFVLGGRRRIDGRCRARAEGVSMGGVGGDGMLVDADRVERVLPGAGVMTKHHLGPRRFLRRRAARRVLVLVVGLVVVLFGRGLARLWRGRRSLRARSRGGYTRPLDLLFRRLGAEEINRAMTTRSRCGR